MLSTLPTAASNFPDHRGTATAFPLAAFGLSAFFWSTVSTIAFKDDTGRFLLLLALGTFALTIVSIPFLRIMPPSDPYAPLSSSESRAESRPLRRTKSSEFSYHTGESDEAGTQSSSTLEPQHSVRGRSQSIVSNSHSHVHNSDVGETSSLVSKSRSSQDSANEGHPKHNTDEDHDDALSDIGMDSPHLDIRGLAMLAKVEFWQLFLTMALLSGLGLMTIKYVNPIC